MFFLADELYAVSVSSIVTVVLATQITMAPNTPEYILGVVNIRGKVVSVIDLKKIFALPTENPSDKNSIVIIKKENVQTGILTDGPVSIVDLTLSDIQSKIMTIRGETSDLIDGQIYIKDNLVALLNADKIIDKTKLALKS